MSKSQQKSAEEILRLLEGIKEKKGEGGISTLPTRRPVDQEKAGAMLGDLEFRSDIAPFLEDNPVAKLGYKLFEEGKVNLQAIPTDKGRGIDDPKLEKLYEATPKYQPVRGYFFKDEDSIDSPGEVSFLNQLRKYNLDEKDIPEGGLATYAFMRDILPPEITRRTIAHELTHAGIEHIFQNLDNYSDEDKEIIKNALSFRGVRRSPPEEAVIDRMEYQTEQNVPSAKIDFDNALKRIKMLTQDNPFVEYVEKDDKKNKPNTPDLIKEVITSKRPGYQRKNVEKFYEIAEKELRKMNVPEKQGQLGFFDKVQRYFEGVF